MKENKKIIIGFGILILIIIVLLIYIIIDKKLSSEKIDQAEKTLIDDVKIDLNSLYQIGDTLNKFDSAFNDSNSKYFGYLYKSDSLLVKDFDKNAALYTTLYNDFIGSNIVQLGATVKNKFAKIFGKQVSYKASSIDVGEHSKISYDEKLNQYSYSSTAINNVYSPGYIAHNISTSLEGENIFVTRKIFYVEYTNGGAIGSNAIIYRDSSKNEKIGELKLRNNVLDEEEVIAKYSSKLKTYKYTFKQQKLDEYNFYSLEKIK